MHKPYKAVYNPIVLGHCLRQATGGTTTSPSRNVVLCVFIVVTIVVYILLLVGCYLYITCSFVYLRIFNRFSMSIILDIRANAIDAVSGEVFFWEIYTWPTFWLKPFLRKFWTPRIYISIRPLYHHDMLYNCRYKNWNGLLDRSSCSIQWRMR